MVRLIRVTFVLLLAGSGLTACASLDQPPTEFAEPEAMREGPGIFTGDHGTIVFRY